MDNLAKVQLLLAKISKGKVTTYGIIAKKLGISSIYVGRLLGMNPHPAKYPCYKAVRSDGSLGGYSGGVGKKASLLRRDGIAVSNGRVDLRKHLFRF